MTQDEIETEVLNESEFLIETKLEKVHDDKNDKKKAIFEEKQQERVEVEYNVGDLVLAKISGYPWWPGMVFPEDAAPDDVKEARPVTKKRKNGTNVQYWLVRFFPEPEYVWASKNDIRPLTLKMIDEFLLKKNVKKDIRESYEIAKTCPTVEDLLAQQEFKTKYETGEEDDEKEEEEEEEEEFSDDVDHLKNGDLDENMKKKNTLKRKTESKKIENKKKKIDESQYERKSNNQGKVLIDGSRTMVNKIPNGKTKSSEHSVFSSEQSSQIKWEQKKQHVLFLRHKLQRIMLTNGKIPSDDDMVVVNEQLEKLETFKGIDVAILRITKIGKVLKRIVQLSEIPSNEKYSIRERSKELLNRWKELLEKPNDDVRDD